MRSMQHLSVVLSLLGGLLSASAAETLTPHPETWTVWPQKNGPAAEVQSDGAWKFSGGNGHIGFRLDGTYGKTLSKVSFRIRSLEEKGGQPVEFHLVEDSGESFYRRVTPRTEWQTITLDPAKLPVFPYGGAKILDGKLAEDKVARFKFNGIFRNNRFEVREFRLTIESAAPVADGAPARCRRLDVSGDAAPGKWIRYEPEKKFVVTLVDNPDNPARKCLRFDMRKGGGHVSVAIPPKQGYVPETLTIRLKADKENREEFLQLLLVERDGESYGKRLRLSENWQTFRLKLGELTLFTDGGAKVTDRKFDLAGLRRLKFNNYPDGHCFLLDGILLEYREQNAEEKAKEEALAHAFRIDPVLLPETFERKDAFYPKAGKIRIADGAFVRGGKKRFLLGGWPLDADANPWIMRTYGLDFYVCNANEIYSLYTPKLENGIPVLRWRENPWMHSHINRFLSSGIDFWLEHTSHAEFSALRNDPRFREILDAGHMVTYDPFHPDGVAMYREMYKSNMRYTREYPVFCYELFNEMMYDNTKKISRDAFKNAMREKYRNDIVRANRVWETDFASFDAVRIPGFLSDDGKNSIPRKEMRNREADRHPALYADFQKFQEARCKEAILKMMPIMRAYDPSANPLTTVQSHMSLNSDHGENGVSPDALSAAGDFITHESGIAFLESRNPSWSAVAGMMKTICFLDAMRYFAKGKPVINGESPIRIRNQSGDEEELALDDLGRLRGRWRFFDATARMPEQWMNPDFNDSSWPEIRVPAMWGREGFPRCQAGLYRKKIMLDSLPAGEKFYLNGNSLADSGEIYCNGKHVGNSEGFARKFSFDLSPFLRKGENLLAIRVVNRFYHDNMYYGGIRGLLSINTEPLVSPEPEPDLEQKHIRAFLWAQAMHGIQGVVICYNTPLFSGAGRAIPCVRQEINNLAELLFSRENRLSGECAFVYPEETTRLIRHKQYLEKMRGPATLDLMPYYTALLFGGYAPHVIRFCDLPALRGKMRLIAAPDALRIRKKDLACLKEHVKNGGWLLLNFNHFRIEDDTHEKLDVSNFTGIRLGDKITAQRRITLSGALSGSDTLRKNFLDQSCGRSVTLCGAEVFCGTPSMPLVTVNSYGRGKVFCINVQTGGRTMERIVRAIAEYAKAERLLRLEKLGKKKELCAVDNTVFRSAEGRVLLCLVDYGTPGNYRMTLSPALLKHARYRMRTADTGRQINSPSGSAEWTREELSSGVGLRLKRFDPAVLLLEPPELPALPLPGISPIRRKICETLWRKESPKPSAPTVGFSLVNGLERTAGTIPTARKMIADQGFQCRSVAAAGDLPNNDVLAWIFPKMPCPDPNAVEKMVRSGGGLLLCGGAVLHYHSQNNNAALFEKFGLKEASAIGSAIYNRDVRLPDFDNMTIRIPVTVRHPVLDGVENVIFRQCNFLTRYPANAVVLLRAPATSSAPGAALAAAFEYGKGRVVYVSDYVFLRPGSLERGDNARFWVNVIGWLASRQPDTRPEKLAASLFLTTEKLETAEQQEQAGNCPPGYPADTPTYLDRTGAPRGLAGGDPVLDMLDAI